MKQKILLILLISAMIAGCNFSESNIDANTDGMDKYDNLSSKNEINNSAGEAINKQSKVR